MFKQLLGKTVYVKVYENYFVLKLVNSDQQPVTTMSKETFTTQRLLIGHFQVAEKVLRQGIKDLFSTSWLPASPAIVIQPMEKIEGGLSEIEERAFRELAAGAGARKVAVWVGDELTESEVIEISNSN